MAVHLHLVAVQICGTNSCWGEQERCPVDLNHSVEGWLGHFLSRTLGLWDSTSGNTTLLCRAT